MFRSSIRAWIRLLIIAGGLLMSAPSALALFSSLSIDLSGPSIGGVVPSGTAAISQGGFPAQPGIVEIRVSNLNLPDGTLLSVSLSDCGPVAVGSMTLFATQAQLKTAFRRGCRIGRLSKILVNNGTATVLSSVRWKF
ncbi:MAG: hypothetical protein HY661_03590 [Betaproteobacteria bacterium]|nr:hypothetical protein [Betaproteobacteria bacterium]